MKKQLPGASCDIIFKSIQCRLEGNLINVKMALHQGQETEKMHEPTSIKIERSNTNLSAGTAFELSFCKPNSPC